MFNTNGNILPVDHPFGIILTDSALKNNLSGKIDAMVTICDAWNYANTLNIPTDICDPGSLALRDAKDEHTVLNMLMKGASVLADTIVDY